MKSSREWLYERLRSEPVREEEQERWNSILSRLSSLTRTGELRLRSGDDRPDSLTAEAGHESTAVRGAFQQVRQAGGDQVQDTQCEAAAPGIADVPAKEPHGNGRGPLRGHLLARHVNQDSDGSAERQWQLPLDSPDREERGKAVAQQAKRKWLTAIAPVKHNKALVAADTARDFLSKALVRARLLAPSVDGEPRLAYARAMAFEAAAAYWDAMQDISADHWPICDLPSSVSLARLSKSAGALARSIGITAAALNVTEATYLIGVLYIATMPGKVRADFGAYYTPPALCERLLDIATEAGVDWRSARVLDPACGGGGFLSPVARRMADTLDDCTPKSALKNILDRVRGFELDPFAAWMSQLFLEVTLADLCRAADTRIPPAVDVCDALWREPEDQGFDLVIGNPPYGRTTLSPRLREKYQRSLYGHANLYGIFTDLALRFTRPGGVIAYVTPTSFLAGQYFKALRGLLGQEAPPTSIEFIAERKGVFADVLQETMLAVYRRGGERGIGQVRFTAQAAQGRIATTAAGSFRLPERPDSPWLVPRAKAHGKLVRGIQGMRYRLADYGYKVSTGPLVWNRHKPSLRDLPGKGRYPLIWAESVRSDGIFEFRACKRNHKPYFEPLPSEAWVVTDFPCVLLQRTTAKEQSRRLIAAEMPDSFVAKHGAVVIENHLNMIRPVNDRPLVSPGALAALLNTSVVDEVFRCINGSVAVSAYELEALPLPHPKAMARIEVLVTQRVDSKTIEQMVQRLYGKEIA